MRKLTLGIAALAATLPATAMAQPMVTNGSFEDATVDPGSGFITLPANSGAITGWKVTGTDIDYIGGYWEASDGVRSLDLNGNAQGGVSQTINDLIIGRRYAVTFDLAGNPDNGGGLKIAVASDGGGFAGVYTFDSTGRTRQDMGWQTQVFRFTANATSANLAFSSAIPGSYGPALDNVGISAVPEPASWALLIMGFGAVGGALRRRAHVRTSVRLA